MHDSPANDPVTGKQTVTQLIAAVPPGRWAVAVSGGADSVALLSLLCGHPDRADLKLHVVHLNHELRGDESDGDAQFVGDLAAQLGLSCTIGLRHQVESTMPALPKNPSARYRAARLALFRTVALEQDFQGVIFAHHADDQAETILQRLLRGSSWGGLGGMRDKTVMNGLTILRPLLRVRQAELREHLLRIGQSWREDSSNVSERYFRNRLRRLLADRPELTERLLGLGESCRTLKKWVNRQAPPLGQSFGADELARLPTILARPAAGRWLMEQRADGSNSARERGITPRAIDLLLEMARDAATPASRQISPRITVRRRRGRIFAEGHS